MELHYSEPRFQMPYWGRFAVRLLTYAGGAFFVAIALVLCFSEMIEFRVIAYLILILALYYLLRIGRSARPISKVSDKHRNIAEYLSPAGYRKVEIALDKTALEQSDFTLNLFNELLKKSKADDEFKAKVESRRKRLSRPQTKAELTEIMNKLMQRAFDEAKAAGADSIAPSHLLLALLKGDFPEILKTFEIFGHKPTDAL